MSDLVRLALTLAGAIASPRPQPWPTHLAMAIVAAAAAALLGTAALAAAAAALWIWAADRFGPVVAPSIVAGGLLALALVAAVVARQVCRPVATSAPAPLPIGDSIEPVLSETARLVQAHKVPVLMTALVAGLVAGLAAGRGRP